MLIARPTIGHPFTAFNYNPMDPKIKNSHLIPLIPLWVEFTVASIPHW